MAYTWGSVKVLSQFWWIWILYCATKYPIICLLHVVEPSNLIYKTGIGTYFHFSIFFPLQYLNFETLLSQDFCYYNVGFAFLRSKNSFFGIWWQRILHEENRRRNRRIEQLKWMGFSMKLWLKLKIFLTFKWRFSSFIQIEVSRSYKISYIIGATGSDRKQKPVQYFHFFQSNDLRTTLMDSGEKI